MKNYVVEGLRDGINDYSLQHPVTVKVNQETIDFTVKDKKEEITYRLTKNDIRNILGAL